MSGGKYTAELGRRVRKCIGEMGDKDLAVYFDHGEKDESSKIVPFFGDYGTATTLSNADLAVVRQKKVLLIC